MPDISNLNGYDLKDKQSRQSIDEHDNRLDEHDLLLEQEKAQRIQKDTELEGKINVEKARVDQITNLPAGSTSGDAELLDIRIGYDGFTHDSAGNAVREQITEIINKKIGYKIKDNLFNPDTVTTKKYLYSDGTLRSDTNFNTSDFIAVKQGKPIVMKSQNLIRFILFYNIAKVADSSSYIDVGQRTYTFVPNADGFIRFTYRNSTTYMYISEENTDIYRLYEKTLENIELSNGQLQQLEDTFHLTEIYDFFEPIYNELELEFQAGKMMNVSGQIENLASSSLATIEINANNKDKIFKITGYAYNLLKPYIFVNNDNKIVAFEPISNIDQNIDILFIPKETGTLYINKYSGHTATVKVYSSLSVNNLVEEVYQELINEQLINMDKILFNKKYVACGDSFTQGDFQYSDEEYQFQSGDYQGENKVYPFIIGDRAGMNVVNLAVGGMALTSGIRENSFTGREIYKTIPSDANYITLKFGINDGHIGAPIGTIDDQTTETFYGAWNIVLDYLIRNYPDARIGIIVSNGLDSIDYATATIAAAKKFGIPYLNEATGEDLPLLIRSLRTDVGSGVKNFRNAQFRVAPNAQYPNNSNTHPNVKCHELESEIVEDFLRRL